ncbi:unnamed protein product [Candidula unifasciata]|uniref:Coiled-coil domain-containing protein 85C n=1 Tax=Candidula unifasciata TaxID=100452 RepID=A0A8S3ZIZ1_9EUPU|nr:unnamed protein product [Candidula unifasciata]
MEWEQQIPNPQSNPSSLSSDSASSGGTRSEKITTLKQIPPSSTVSTLSKLTDDELRKKGVEDLLRIVRRVEADYKSLLREHGNMVKDVNQRLQIFMLETRSLKEFNQKLQDDNQELRDLCCFLDDDRQRGRKLAREWQRFGRYTASVMRSEVAVYQEKLRELEDKQNELIIENMELKELCLFLDQERVRMTGDRDEGDGSSNGTVTGHEDGIGETAGSGAAGQSVPVPSSYPVSPSSTASYIRELEQKVRLLEEEKKLLAQRVDHVTADGHDVLSPLFTSTPSGHTLNKEHTQSLHGLKPGAILLRKSPVSSKPETVMHAMKVLQVHEELEKTPTDNDGLDDPEKAIVREMCNVVWRTLGDVEDIGSFNESSDSIQEPPFVAELAPPGKPSVPSSSDQTYGQGHTFAYTNTQTAAKQSNVGGHFPAATAGPASFQPQPQRKVFPKPVQDSKQQQVSQLLYSQGYSDSGMRNNQGSATERLGIDRNRSGSYKQSVERADDQKSQDQKHPSHTVLDAGGKPHAQQLPTHLQHQQPPPLSSRDYQQSLPDSGSNIYPGHQRPAELSARSAPLPVHFQQPQPSTIHQHSQSSTAVATHAHPSHRPADLNARPGDHPLHYQPPQHLPSSSIPGNQRIVDSSTNKLQNERGHSQHNDANSFAGNQPQQQRNTKAYPHQQVKLLDAPGTSRHFQRSAPTQGQVHSRDSVREDSSLGQTRLHSRGDPAYSERNSSERDPQLHLASRSLSSSTLPNTSNVQIPVQNLQGVKSAQNSKGPSVFRAYPPQLASLPAQSVSSRGSQNQEMSSGSSQNQQDATRGIYISGNHPQNKGSLAGKRLQESEWRQTYLDDSDTL